MTQKINLGGYETRDFFVGLEADLSSGESFEESVSIARELCSKEVQDYYRKIKDKMNSPSTDRPSGMPDDLFALYEKVVTSTNLEQLDALRETVAKTAESKHKDEITKAFNRMIIKFND